MAFLISDIRRTSPQNGCRYFFDSNVWLAVLYDFYNKPYFDPYTKFFNEIIRNRTAPTATIAMPSLLISELINRIMNDIYYYEYCLHTPMADGEKKHTHYKKNYRQSADYLLDLEDACVSIRDYKDKISFISDSLNEYTCDTLIKNIPRHLDFNDHVFTKVALKQNLVLVTNDSDFRVENISILTTQTSLLKLA
ncbi:PIN domain-containing protein [Ferruginibacter paludis]|uniref:PIN domain-containing protein n=1 Tax=Ferruginibacter paludis TaxID=1310417 RepID=UPI0025B3F183|nr:PIN domain-containing protein [Ferruginibacter paludis]MDN3657963.1 PIN domain-containing protein [Ferruginibacter paludis]